jgi:hypothetical protein
MMTPADTLAELLQKNRGVKRVVSYLEGENSERVVGYDAKTWQAFHLHRPQDAGSYRRVCRRRR